MRLLTQLLALARAEGNRDGVARLVRTVDTARMLESAWIAQRISESKQCASAWSTIEPHVPWDLDTLNARRDCYQRTQDPRRWESARDVEQWKRCEASPSWLRNSPRRPSPRWWCGPPRPTSP